MHGPCVSQPRGIYMQIQGYPLPALDSLCPVFPHFLGSLVLLSSGLDSSAFLDSHFFISVPACLVYWRVPPGQKFIMHISHPLLPCFKCHILSSFSPLLIVFTRGSSQPRDRTQVSGIAGGFFAGWATRKARCPRMCTNNQHISTLPVKPNNTIPNNWYCIDFSM